jgi:hypothetical protein
MAAIVRTMIRRAAPACSSFGIARPAAALFQTRGVKTMTFGDTKEEVVERSDYPRDKIKDIFKNDTFAVVGYGVQVTVLFCLRSDKERKREGEGGRRKGGDVIIVRSPLLSSNTLLALEIRVVCSSASRMLSLKRRGISQSGDRTSEKKGLFILFFKRLSATD